MVEAPGSRSLSSASWVALSSDHIESLLRIAEQIHPGLPESREVFAERVKLFPEGCLGLVIEGKLCGYAISHPIRRRQPPALNSLLQWVSPEADQYYIHDLAILPEVQGRGYAQECVQKLLSVAERYPSTGLVSVYGTAVFWSRFGFKPIASDSTMETKLLDYGDDAVYLERANTTPA